MGLGTGQVVLGQIPRGPRGHRLCLSCSPLAREVTSRPRKALRTLESQGVQGVSADVPPPGTGLLSPQQAGTGWELSRPCGSRDATLRSSPAPTGPSHAPRKSSGLSRECPVGHRPPRLLFPRACTEPSTRGSRTHALPYSGLISHTSRCLPLLAPSCWKCGHP